MNHKNLRFGAFLRKKRKENSVTLQQIADETGWSYGMVSFLECKGKTTSNKEKLAKMFKLLKLSEEETALAFDLMARENSKVPADIENVFMYSDAGEYARIALRMTNAGFADEDDWKEFVGALLEKKKHKEN